MKIILKEKVDNLGVKGDTVEVKDGFARNYLLPKKLAVLFSEGNLAMVHREKEKIQIQKTREKEEAEAFSEKIADVSVTISKKVGEGDTLYGSVTAAEIGEALNSEGFEIDKRKIVIEEPIKKLGIYKVAVRLHPEVTGDFKVWVVKE